MRERRQKFDLQDGLENQDLYGAKTKDQNAFELDEADDFFGVGGQQDDLLNDPGYQRLDNGMGVNENAGDMKK